MLDRTPIFSYVNGEHVAQWYSDDLGFVLEFDGKPRIHYAVRQGAREDAIADAKRLLGLPGDEDAPL